MLLKSSIQFNDILQPFPFICDDFTSFEIGVPFTIEKPRTFYTLFRVQIPLNLQYNLIKNRLDLRSGVIFNLPLLKEISRGETHTRNVSEDENSIICELIEPHIETDNSNLAPFSLSGSIGVDLQLVQRVRINVVLIKNLTPINRTATNDRVEFPIRYRPLYIQAGLSIDIIKKENIETKKTNYLLARQQK